MSTGVPNLNPTNPKGMTSNYNTDYNSETTTNPIGPASQLKGHAQYVTGAAQVRLAILSYLASFPAA